jgi:hypothetical protein
MDKHAPRLQRHALVWSDQQASFRGLNVSDYAVRKFPCQSEP